MLMEAFPRAGLHNAGLHLRVIHALTMSLHTLIAIVTLSTLLTASAEVGIIPKCSDNGNVQVRNQ